MNPKQSKKGIELRKEDDARMSLNQKLTRVVKGRIIEDLQMSPLEVSFRFSDGSNMQVKVMESNSSPLKNGAKLNAVFEQSTSLEDSVRGRESTLPYPCGSRLFGHSPRRNWCSRILRIDK